MIQSSQKNAASRRLGFPWGIVSLTINAICFGGCLVLLAMGTITGPLVLCTIGTGLSAGAGFAAALRDGRHQRSQPREPESSPRHP
ncbi:MAG: hypothetical protein H7A46_17990 [Verrucomicrobiales bacterium]|nr:hypothetical protein [Verrucomicrobiales bacterium]